LLITYKALNGLAHQYLSALKAL